MSADSCPLESAEEHFAFQEDLILQFLIYFWPIFTCTIHGEIQIAFNKHLSRDILIQFIRRIIIFLNKENKKEGINICNIYSYCQVCIEHLIHTRC